jgi:RNA polymerase sigma factor (TIGR02999 family)
MDSDGTGGEVTELLHGWSDGDASARDRLIPLVYEELRRLARSQLRRERSDHTLSSAALIHEAYLRLTGQRSVSWRDRAHFFGVAASLMRRVLVDHARARNARIRGGGARRVPLEDAVGLGEEPDIDVLAVHQALCGLEALDPDLARLVELRFFAGLDLEETGAALGVSRATVARDWQMARAWLHRSLSSGP